MPVLFYSKLCYTPISLIHTVEVGETAGLNFSAISILETILEVFFHLLKSFKHGHLSYFCLYMSSEHTLPFQLLI